MSGSGTDVGKTVTTAALLRALRLGGWAAQAVKPVQTGVPPKNLSSAPLADMSVYAAAVADLSPRLFPSVSPAACLHCFPLPASPHLAAARSGARLTCAGLAKDVAQQAHASGAAVLLLEGAGGLRVPLNDDEDLLDLMALLGLPVLLVGGNCLGGINHILLSLDALAARGLPLAGLVLTPTERPDAGCPGVDVPAMLADTARLLRVRLRAAGWSDAPVLELPRVPQLDAAAWDLLARRLEPLARQCAALAAPLDMPTGHAGAPAALARAKACVASALGLADAVKPCAPAEIAAGSGEAAAGPNATAADAAASLIARDHAAVWHPYAAACPPPVLDAVRSTCGNRILLQDGRELVDGMSSWWAAIHGYNHPRLLAALQAQARCMPHIMFGGLTHEPAVALAERLLGLMPSGLGKVFFADSGSVAVEVALKMALQCQRGRGEAQRTRFLTPRGGYHGDTFGAMSVCDPVTGMHSLFTAALPRQIFMERPACRFDQPFDPSSLDDARRLLAAHGPEVAAVILEPVVQGAGGMWFYHPDYLRGLADLCREAGALLILDEIATGFGRTGKMFAAEWAGICPDILCCGKALTGGMLTLAATACTDSVAEDICRHNGVLMHGPTFMANALACAVAGASLDLLAENAWPEQVARLEATLRAGLAPCAAEPDVADVRVLGAIGVVETRRPVHTARLQRYFVERGVWLRPFNRLIYIMPPYNTPPEDAARLCAAVRGALREGAHRP